MRVLDSQGRPLARAAVKIGGTGAEQTMETSDAGLARFENLTPGRYGVGVTLKNFLADSVPVVSVRAGRVSESRVTMTLFYYPPDGDMPRVQPQQATPGQR